MMKRYFIAGGAGFIGAHLAEHILAEEKRCRVTLYDNFSSGRMWHLEKIKNDPRLKIIRGDVKDIRKLVASMKGADIVYHLASNPDISLAITRPDVDFWEGTYLTNNVLEAMRIDRVPELIYASGSGVYGDAGYKNIGEDYAMKLPISTYGASKLAGESLISAYCYLFGMNASSLRFANVVGPRQTHGVCYDFVKKLKQHPKILTIMGDGRQSKAYIYITDVLHAMRLVEKKMPKGFSYYNVSTSDYIQVRQIADIVVRSMGLTRVRYRYTGGDRGWKGDVPVVRLRSEKIRRLGWRNRYTSRGAIESSVSSICQDAGLDRFGWGV